LSIVIPPSKVPGPISIVSPFCAAFTAACTVEKHPTFVPTHSVVDGAERAAEVVAAQATAANAASGTTLRR
jgi:hypothetical protein